jgi:diacylglycerol kinase family enzyme
MKVSLLYNKDAGAGVSLAQIRRALEEHGHDPVRIVENEADSSLLLDERCELVVVAGGDGTVSTAARLLAGRGVPLAILPLGTANNIARSVGSPDSIDQAIRSWNGARPVPFDLGVASGSWGERRFVEAVGGGLIPAGIATMNARPVADEAPLPSKLASAVRRYGDVLSRLKARRWTLSLDGSRTSGDFLLVEILNTRFVGPNLALSEHTNASDGFFTVVMGGEEHREELACYLNRAEGRDCRLSLKTLRARHVEVHDGADIHVDDQVFGGPSPSIVSIQIEPAALTLLVGTARPRMPAH